MDIKICAWSKRYGILKDVLVLLNFPHLSSERAEIGSLGAGESEVWIGNLNVKARKTTEHKLHKIWRSLKFCKILGKWEHPWEYSGSLHTSFPDTNSSLRSSSLGECDEYSD